jgi:plastocyanin
VYDVHDTGSELTWVPRAVLEGLNLRVDAQRRQLVTILRLLLLTSLVGCSRPVTPHADSAASARGARAAYVPVRREITVTTVPLLVKEQQALFPFLKRDFGAGGVLDGKEVYAFAPSTITVVQGDTIHFTFINPEDDAHSFVLPDLAVALPGQSTTTATYVARRAGIYPFVCSIASHLPMMAGQLVVLAPFALGDAAAGPR